MGTGRTVGRTGNDRSRFYWWILPGGVQMSPEIPADAFMITGEALPLRAI